MTQHKTCMIYCQGVISVMKNKEEWKARGAVGEKENLFQVVGGDRWKAAGMNWLSTHMGSYDYHVNYIFLYFVGNMVYYAYHAIYSTTIFLFLFFFTVMNRSLCIPLLTLSSSVFRYIFLEVHFGVTVCVPLGSWPSLTLCYEEPGGGEYRLGVSLL